MIDFEKACAIAHKHFSKHGINGLNEANDLGDAWLFAGGDPDSNIDGGWAVTVDKASGEVEPFILPDKTNFKRLEKAVQVDIPEKYAY